ncbi:hypothetical protein [Herbaspirillum huttiense]|uniref:Transmembrane protein n=1 Tax=Herbaspirillum huttiense subsp. lycopersici TaxID=3074428 RepID=A0ABU2ETV9_9BURK|nr:hypothetical protein [Herbaspirillum huttiense]MDR9851614.1 hypothetical protein [Herbaspirillum huttiense SE1]
MSRKISHRGFPRLFMLLLITLAASLGLLASAWMLRHGWHNMGLRYGLACLVAYPGFLLMLSVWLWLLRRRDRRRALAGTGVAASAGAQFASGVQPEQDGRNRRNDGSGIDAGFVGDIPLNISLSKSAQQWQGGGGSFDGGGASANVDFSLADGGDAAGLADGIDLGEALGLLIFAVSVVSLIAAALYSVVTMLGMAPVLFSELIFDALLAAGLYRRFGYRTDRHWLETAVQRTWRPFLAVLLLVSASGLLLSLIWPDAVTLGEVWSQLRS